MRSHPGNLHKEAKALPSSKARPNKAQLRSTLEQKGSFLAITSNVYSQSPSSVKSGSRSQPQLKNPHEQISQASPH